MSTKKKVVANLTHDYLKSVLHYNPRNGHWTWIKCGKPRFNGCRADFPRDKSRSYLIVTINKKKYYSHRLAWFYMTGNWPPMDLDHRDTIKSNNAWSNLRLATDSQNNANKIPVERDVPKGVDKLKWGYQARIKVNLKNIHLGTFKTAEEAHQAYLSAAKTHFGEFTRIK